jgi:predicted Rossmann fold nucleotide-binding protein DprA/Smf involved in DNA uptake
MDLRTLSIGQEQYPESLLSRIDKKMPPTLWYWGDESLINRRKLGIVCSVKCPGNIIMQASTLMKNLPAENLVVVSGFHSPLEKECMRILGRRRIAMICILGRSLIGACISAEWKTLVEEERLLLVSSFDKQYNRLTQSLSEKRNELVAALADELWILHASPGSRTESLALNMTRSGKDVFTLRDESNANLRTCGVPTLNT